MPELIEGLSQDIMDEEGLKSKFAFYFDYSSAPNGPIGQFGYCGAEISRGNERQAWYGNTTVLSGQWYQARLIYSWNTI